MKQKKIKKANLPIDKMTEKEKNYVAVVLEEVRSNFEMFGETMMGFGEKLELVKQKGDATFEEVGRIKIEIGGIKEEIGGIKEEIGGMKEEIGGMKGEMAEMNVRLDRIEAEVASLRSEISELKNILTKKVDIDYIKKLEIRLIRVERYLKLKIA